MTTQKNTVNTHKGNPRIQNICTVHIVKYP